MRIPRKSALVVLASISIAGLAGASAASFGGITSGSIGSDSTIVAACDAGGMSVAYTAAYNPTTQRNEVSAVTFSGVDAGCDGLDATVSVANGTTTLNSTNVNPISVTGGAFSITLSSAVDANLLNRLSLVIVG